MIKGLKSTDLINNVRNRLFLDNSKVITEEHILKIETLNISKFGYNFKENVFFPEELQYFKNLKKCEFSGIEIDEKIIESLNKIDFLEDIDFDNCTKNTEMKLDNNIKKITIVNSDLEFLKLINNTKNVQEIYMRAIPTNDSQNVFDINDLTHFINLRKIRIYNYNIKNSALLSNFSKIKLLDLDGSKLDDKSVINKIDCATNIHDNFYFKE